MRIVKASNGVLFLGKQGENLATQVQFTVEAWIKELGDGSFQLLHQRKTDQDPHAVTVTYTDGVVYWDVENTEVAVVGYGKCELQFYKGTTLAKSQTWITQTAESLSAAGDTPPEPWESWVEEVLQAGSQAQQSAQEAEEAKGAAEDARDSAQTFAENAENSAEQAEHSAGNAATYANNAFLYKNAAESARDDAISAKEDAETAKGDAEVAKDEAVQAKQGALAAEENAHAYAQNAFQSKTGAETAKNQAESARDLAENYADDAKEAAETAAEETVELVRQEMTGYVAAAQTAKNDAQGFASDAETSKDDAETAKAGAVSAKTAAESAQSVAETARDSAVSAKEDAISAKEDAETAKTQAETAKEDAETAKTGAESARDLADGSAEDAEAWAVGKRGGVDVPSTDPAYNNSSKYHADESKAAKEDIEDSIEGVAQEDTAQSALSKINEITGFLQTIVQRHEEVRYYDVLPAQGTEGYTYITPDGIYHFHNGEYVQLSGSGDLNGFSLNLGGNNEVLLSYTDPDDETITDTITMPTIDTINRVISALGDIVISLAKIAGQEE